MKIETIISLSTTHPYSYLVLKQTMDLDAPDDEHTDCEESLQIVMDEPEEPQSLENDPRLLEMAKQSALCMHEILGVRYDESREVDIEDVKFVVVQMALPLGSK